MIKLSEDQHKRLVAMLIELRLIPNPPDYGVLTLDFADNNIRNSSFTAKKKVEISKVEVNIVVR